MKTYRHRLLLSFSLAALVLMNDAAARASDESDVLHDMTKCDMAVLTNVEASALRKWHENDPVAGQMYEKLAQTCRRLCPDSLFTLGVMLKATQISQIEHGLQSNFATELHEPIISSLLHVPNWEDDAEIEFRLHQVIADWVDRSRIDADKEAQLRRAEQLAQIAVDRVLGSGNENYKWQRLADLAWVRESQKKYGEAARLYEQAFPLVRKSSSDPKEIEGMLFAIQQAQELAGNKNEAAATKQRRFDVLNQLAQDARSRGDHLTEARSLLQLAFLSTWTGTSGTGEYYNRAISTVLRYPNLHNLEAEFRREGARLGFESREKWDPPGPDAFPLYVEPPIKKKAQ